MARSKPTPAPKPVPIPPPAEPAPVAVPEPTPATEPTEDRLHESSGYSCTVPHADGEGPCQRCKWCDRKFRPSQMAQPCPARAG